MRLDDRMNAGFVNMAAHFVNEPLYRKMDKDKQDLLLKILRMGYDKGFLDGLNYESKRAVEATG